MVLNLDYIGTKAGIFKCINVVFGLVSVAMISAGHDKHGIAKSPSVICYHNFRPCVQVWAAHLGMSLIVIAWAYSIGILLLSIFKNWNNTAAFGWLDIYGHQISGLLLIAANIFLIVYLTTLSPLLCHIYEIVDKDLVTDTKICSAHFIFVESHFVLWVLGLIFSGGLAFLVNVTWFIVKRQRAALGPETPPMINGI